MASAETDEAPAPDELEQGLLAQFDRAAALSGAERDAYLGRIAQSAGEERRSRLMVLLAAHDSLQAGVIDLAAEGLDELRKRLSPVQDAGVLTGQTIAGFTIGPLVGQGATGAVYRARQSRPARDVAFKTLRLELTSPKLRRRFQMEAEHLALLSHPNIAGVLAASEADSPVTWMATEFVPDALRVTDYCRGKQLTLHRRMEMALSVIDAVASAHSRGVLHRDIKPSNVLVSGEGAVKVIDFGLARMGVSGADAARTMATEQGEILGTLAYMAPEQCLGDARLVDVRADVFALGAVLFELAAGEKMRSLGEASLTNALHAVANQSVRQLRTAMAEAPKDLDAIVAMATALEPGSRYQTAGAMAADLRRLLNGEPVEARPPGLARRFWSWVKRRPTLAVTGAVAIVGAIVAAALLWAVVDDQLADAARAMEVTNRIVDRLVPAVRGLGATQDAPLVREIQEAAYELAVLENGPANVHCVSLASKVAFDWMKGTGADDDRARHWFEVARDSARRIVATGKGQPDPDGSIARAGRLLQDAEIQLALMRPLTAGDPEAGKLEQLAIETEAIDDVDATSDLLLRAGEQRALDGDHAGAIDFMRRARVRSERINGADAVRTVSSRSVYLMYLIKHGNPEAALAEAEDLIALQMRADRETAIWTLNFKAKRGVILGRLGRDEESLAALVEAEGLISQWVGPKTAMRNRARASLREVLVKLGRADEADREWAPVPEE